MLSHAEHGIAHIELRQEIEIMWLFVVAVHADGNRQVGLMRRIEPDLPARGPRRSQLAPGNDDSHGDLAVDQQEVGQRILNDAATRGHHAIDDVLDDDGMQSAKRAVDLDIAIVVIGRETDQGVCPEQATKARLEGTARRAVFCLVDYQAR